jgi:hypothetical protein
MEKKYCDVKKTKEFFRKLDKGCSLPSHTKFRGLTLKNRPSHEMICDCCGSGDDCCGFN